MWVTSHQPTGKVLGIHFPQRMPLEIEEKDGYGPCCISATYRPTGLTINLYPPTSVKKRRSRFCVNQARHCDEVGKVSKVWRFSNKRALAAWGGSSRRSISFSKVSSFRLDVIPSAANSVSTR